MPPCTHTLPPPHPLQALEPRPGGVPWSGQGRPHHLDGNVRRLGGGARPPDGAAPPAGGAGVGRGGGPGRPCARQPASSGRGGWACLGRAAGGLTATATRQPCTPPGDRVSGRVTWCRARPDMATERGWTTSIRLFLLLGSAMVASTSLGAISVDQKLQFACHRSISSTSGTSATYSTARRNVPQRPSIGNTFHIIHGVALTTRTAWLAPPDTSCFWLEDASHAVGAGPGLLQRR